MEPAERSLPEFQFFVPTSHLLIHPLTLNEVLETIFGYLSVSDLKSVRLVSNSSVWQETATTAILSLCSLHAPRVKPGSTRETFESRRIAFISLLRKCPSPRAIFSLHVEEVEEFQFYFAIDVDTLHNRVRHLKYDDESSESETESPMKSLAYILQKFPSLSQLTLTIDTLDFSLLPCPASMRKVQRKENGHLQLLKKLNGLKRIHLLYPLQQSALTSFMEPEISRQLHAISSIQLYGNPEKLTWIFQEFTRARARARARTWARGWANERRRPVPMDVLPWNIQEIDLTFDGGIPDLAIIRQFLLRFALTLTKLHLKFRVNRVDPSESFVPEGDSEGDDNEGHGAAAAPEPTNTDKHWRKDDWLLPEGLVKLSALKITAESNHRETIEPELARTLIAALSLPALTHLELVTRPHCQWEKLHELIYNKGRRCKFPHLGLESTWENSNCNDWIVQSGSLKELTVRHFGRIDHKSRTEGPPPTFLPAYLWPNLSKVTAELKNDDWGNAVYIQNIFVQAQYHRVKRLHLIFNIDDDQKWRDRKFKRVDEEKEKRVSMDDFIRRMKSITWTDDGITQHFRERREENEKTLLKIQESVLDCLFDGENEYDHQAKKSDSNSVSTSRASCSFNSGALMANRQEFFSLSRSLRNLKELTHLTIENKMQPRHRASMTDFTIYRILMEMDLKKLQRLEIRGHGFSADAVQDLKTFLGQFVSVNV